MKATNHMMNSIDEEKAFNKIHHAFKVKLPGSVGLEGIYFKIIKAICDERIANIILYVEKLQGNPLKTEEDRLPSQFSMLCWRHYIEQYRQRRKFKSIHL